MVSTEASDAFRFTHLGEWQTWNAGQRRVEGFVRGAKGRLRRDDSVEVPGATLLLPSGAPRVLVVLDKLTPSCSAAVAEPLQHLDPATTAVLVTADAEMPASLMALRATPYAGPDSLPRSIGAVLSLGGYLGLSEPLVPWCAAHDAAFVVVQHGLLTPFAPPAPEGARVLAWTDGDAEFWRAGRPDVQVEVVGSQMLWSAAALPQASVADDTPVVLGQLHGIELARRDAFFAYWEFCRSVRSEYRPHPNEQDAVSRGLHEIMRRGGIRFETSGLPLPELGRPVVSIFSTGTLEAAHRGLPAWVEHPDPPEWVQAFWRRYGLARYGSRPTQPWAMPSIEPARAVADAVEALA